MVNLRMQFYAEAQPNAIYYFVFQFNHIVGSRMSVRIHYYEGLLMPYGSSAMSATLPPALLYEPCGGYLNPSFYVVMRNVAIMTYAFV